MIKSILYFLLACIFEVGGGYLVWIWLKNDRPLWIGILGMVMLAVYGVVATLQTSTFGRVFAGYGGIFIVFSIVWAMVFDKFKPDRFDIVGAVLILLGVFIMLYGRNFIK
ncbi:hypothetical protein BKH43_02090 [Helicobacter sp. 13S00401-1]|uniref:YnfA family protein n=1 Tax=Helicobacter sp. 13S00401-1 TaxID=1905758 RepID=UPI000BA4E732|nr:YnfA family protein [Helicobacter sp. 13S00401-1]PAF51454.1 hypothetical protein BKH43_02090 [Helicobacter sp. 13S00401-1]